MALNSCTQVNPFRRLCDVLRKKYLIARSKKMYKWN